VYGRNGGEVATQGKEGMRVEELDNVEGLVELCR